MEVEEPSEKVEISDARGEPQLESINDTPKEVIRNGDQILEEVEKELDGKAEIKRTRAVYSWEDLNALKDSPASKVWPAFIEEGCLRNGRWDPELWHHTPASAKRCASPVEEHIRRQIILEDGIILSPQRQSFGQGCHVPQSAPERGSQQERTKSMLSRTTERDSRDGRSRLTGRVGRGSRSVDFRVNQREKSTRNGDLRQTSPWERDRNEKDYKRSRDEDSYSYKRGKKRYEDLEPEPEWMTYGPTSQLETIELRGFDREEMFGKKSKTAEGRIKEQLENQKNRDSSKEQKIKEKDFDINEFFVSDAFLNFSDVLEKGISNASRFSQFFGFGERKDGSRRSSAAEELLEYSGVSSGSPSTPRTPSPSPNFMFTPIKPVNASTEPENLVEMLQKTKIDVKPLLETVMSSGKNDMDRVKGQCRLEDIEKIVENGDESEAPVNQEEPQEKDTDGEDMSAFFKLVENMKTSGHLPEKPQPVIPGLPSRLLPRPPSPKTKQPRCTPSPVPKFPRSPSPVEMLENMIQRHQIPSPSAVPSPPQVVPQMDRPYSSYDIPMHKSVGMLRRSPSPLNSTYDHPKRFSPLLTPNAFMSPSPMHPLPPNRGNQGHQYMDKPHFELPNELPAKPLYNTPKQTPKASNTSMPNATPKSQSSALRDLAFMPTSVLQKIKKDQMTPKSKLEADDSKKDKLENGFEDSHQTMPEYKRMKQATQPLSPKVSDQHLPGKEQPRSMFQPFSNETTLLKPTAFKPYSGMSPGSVSPLRSGVHSEPQSPVTRTQASTSHNRVPVPSSAPVTPQRPPHAEHQLISNQELQYRHLNSGPLNRQDEFQRLGERAAKSVIQDKQSVPSVDGSILNRQMAEESMRFSNDVKMRNEMADHHTRQDHEHQQQMLLQHAVQQQQQQQQQQLRRAAKSVIQDKQSVASVDGSILNRHQVQMPEESMRFSNDVKMRNEMADHHARQEHEHQQQMLLQHAIQRQQQQQQLRREAYNNMYRNRPTPHMMGGQVSPQSILGSPPPPRTPYNTPIPNMHPQGKQGVHPAMMRPPIRPPYLRMMSPRISSMPMQTPAALMQMMPQHPAMMCAPGHSPMPGRHGYGPMNPPMMPPSTNFPVPRHPGLMAHQGKAPQPQNPNPRLSPSDNLLSRWFSEEVLRGTPSQASIPSVHDKKVMSVEDLERQQSMFTALT